MPPNELQDGDGGYYFVDRVMPDNRAWFVRLRLLGCSSEWSVFWSCMCRRSLDVYKLKDVEWLLTNKPDEHPAKSWKNMMERSVAPISEKTLQRLEAQLGECPDADD